MIYLSEKDLLDLGRNWNELTSVIEEASRLIRVSDFAQPVKPYLRYRNMNNRIIAMPAFVGGPFSMAGIKWIASFPSNIDAGLSRAHSVTILNEADTGRPLSIINTTLISAIRTAAVTGFFIREMIRRRSPRDKFKVGIAGFGIIGRTHLEMIQGLLGSQLSDVFIYDIRPSVLSSYAQATPGVNLVMADSWQQAYTDADIFITCTVSKERYIDLQPKKGSLQLNVSLRDYQPALRQAMDHIFVDNWEEICRENTDIEKMHLEEGLEKEDTIAITALTDPDQPIPLNDQDVIMFNPMGMAVYDIAIASYYYNRSIEKNIGTSLQ